MLYLIVALLSLLLVGPDDARAHRDRDSDRPNFLLIVSDDQGSSDLSLYAGDGSRPDRLPNVVHTPNIDSLAHDGARIDRFYVQPFCVPTRAALMAGRINGGSQYAFGGGLRYPPPDFDTMPERFQRAGYQTVLLGKWHLGRGAEQHPNRNGFEHFYGFLGSAIDYFTKTGPSRGPPIFYGPPPFDWQRNGADVRNDAGSPDQAEKWAPFQLAAEYELILEERKRRGDERPLFVVLSLPSPHGPHSAPREFRDAARAEGPFLHRYRATVNAQDEAVGRVLASIDRHGLYRDTLVMFFTDNGGSLGASNRPFRGGKFSVYEGGIRAGALIRYPGRLRRRVVTQPMQVGDLWATFERAAGLPREAPTASVDRWRAITGRGRSKPLRPMFFSNRLNDCQGCCCSLTTGPWRKASSIIFGRWKLVKGARFQGVAPRERRIPGTDFVELYDLEKDPTESTNLVSRYTRLQRFLDWLVDFFDPREPPIS